MSLLGLLTRRHALLSAVAACTSLYGIAHSENFPFDTSDIARIRRRLLGLFTDWQSVATVGAAYLRTADAEAPFEQLMLAVLGGKRACFAPAQLSREIDALVRRDFTNDAWVAVDGWMLSRTEARLCGLIASVDTSRHGSRQMPPP